MALNLLLMTGGQIRKRSPLYNHDPYNSVILTDVAGRVRFVDMIDGATLQQVTDEQTGHVQKVVIKSKDKNLTPTITIKSHDGIKKSFNIPTAAYFWVEEGENIPAGTIAPKYRSSKPRAVILPERRNASVGGDCRTDSRE